jgi:hypothetical protein
MLLISATPASGQRYVPPDENPQYFPDAVFGGGQTRLARYYSWYLRSMREKPLAECIAGDTSQAYRVLIVTRPYNAPVVVRLAVGATGGGDLVSKVARDGGHPDIVTLDRTAKVSQEDVQRFVSLLDAADFWSMPSQKPPDIHKVVMGAVDWMLEAEKHGAYHAVERTTPELGPLKDAAIFLVIRLAKLDLRSLPVGPAGEHP